MECMAYNLDDSHSATIRAIPSRNATVPLHHHPPPPGSRYPGVILSSGSASRVPRGSVFQLDQTHYPGYGGPVEDGVDSSAMFPCGPRTLDESLSERVEAQPIMHPFVGYCHSGNGQHGELGTANQPIKKLSDLKFEKSTEPNFVPCAHVSQRISLGKPTNCNSTPPVGGSTTSDQDRASPELAADSSGVGVQETSKSTSTRGVDFSEVQSSADAKPTLSYIGLIAKAIMESCQSRLSLGSIYSWIEQNYPYFKSRGQGWRNSVRHNLSLNDCFIKAGRCEDGKGNYWAIHPANLQDFLRGDFRQRRRSRRRGRRKEVEYSLYSGYLGSGTTSINPALPYLTQPAFPPMFSPYTEAERRAYRLDEALLRQSLSNPFVKWYGGVNAPYPGASPGSTGYAQGMVQWAQGYGEAPNPPLYQFSGFTPQI